MLNNNYVKLLTMMFRRNTRHRDIFDACEIFPDKFLTACRERRYKTNNVASQKIAKSRIIIVENTDKEGCMRDVTLKASVQRVNKILY